MTSLLLAGVLLAGGVLAFLAGAALAWGRHPLLGYTVGGAGTIALVVGAIFARNAMVGRFLEAEDGGEEP